MSTARREFGQHLRDERERRGLSLQAIADSTKIPLHLLAGLERGDIRHWPDGLFGRAHLRAYATAVGLSPDQLIVEFFRLSNGAPDAPPPARVLRTPAVEGGSRLALAEEQSWISSAAGMRAVASTVDVCAILAVGAVLARMLGMDATPVSAVVGLVYYAISTLALGQSAALWWLGRRTIRRALSTANLRARVMTLDIDRTAAASRPD